MIKVAVCLAIMLNIASEINCGIILNGNGFIKSGKINIYARDGKLHCGSLSCPLNSRCIITQKNDPKELTNLITREKCFDEDDNLTQQNEKNEQIESDNIINVRYESGAGSTYISDPALAREINEHVHDTVSRTLQNVQDSLSNTFSKPFFGDNWPFGNKNNPFGEGFPFNRRPVKNQPDNSDFDIRTGARADPGKAGAGEGVGTGLEVGSADREVVPEIKLLETNKKKITREDIDSDEEISNGVAKF